MRRSYTAWNAALNDYERAYNDYQAMSEELKQAPEIMGTLSAIYQGKALCFLALNNPKDALENFSQRLKNDFLRGGHMTEKKSRITQLEIQAATDLISAMRTKAECLSLIDQAQATTEFANAVAEADKLLWCPVMSIQNEYERLLIAAAQQQLQLKEKDAAIAYLTKLMQRHESLRDGAQNDSTREHFARKAKNLQEVIAQLKAGDEKPAIEEVVETPVEQPVVAQEPQKELSTKQATKKSGSGKKKK
jgi:tetratricopeptide (TPR) repeat protein